jgi:hypothetical protein
MKNEKDFKALCHKVFVGDRDKEMAALLKGMKRDRKKAWRFFRGDIAVTKMRKKWYKKNTYAMTCPRCQFKWSDWGKSGPVVCNNCSGLILMSCDNKEISDFSSHELNSTHEYVIQKGGFMWLLSFLKRRGIMLYHKPYHLYKN